MVRHVHASGTAFEIGHKHGLEAKEEVEGSIAFYRDYFKLRTGKTWPEVQAVSRQFLPYLETAWPAYVEEMKGLAEGSGKDFESILALNVRTEIAFGMLSDGCTAFSWRSKTGSFQAQNWDWEGTQQHNIICLHIEKAGKPRIAMMTEAGILGKIGLNSAGVGVTLNAIQVKGVAFDKLPCHLALRTVLESTSMQEARDTLVGAGVAASCHILIADGEVGGVGLECTAFKIVELTQENGIVTHSNHLIKPNSAPDGFQLTDSPFRLERIQELLAGIKEEPTMVNLAETLKDEKNYPAAICRSQTEKSGLRTLFSIVMDLQLKRARVKMGKPNEGGEEFTLEP